MGISIVECQRILDIVEPGELFTGDKAIMHKEYLKLVKKWHPDNPENQKAIDGTTLNNVMQKINCLYEQGLKMIEAGTWKKPGLIEIPIANRKQIKLSFRKEHTFELGKMYVADRHVTYIMESKYRYLYDNAIERINGLQYANSDMQKEASRYMPHIKEQFETIDGGLGLIISKTPDLIMLRDVIEYYKGKIPDRHVAWILSGLYGIERYFKFSGLTHNAITVENYFISPLYHSGSLLGGWWYAVGEKEKMLGVPAEVYSIMPPEMKNNKTSDAMLDLESVRLLGRISLGDRSGASLYRAGVPEALINWVRGLSTGDAAKDQSNWDACILNSYGERKFVEMAITADDVYGKK